MQWLWEGLSSGGGHARAGLTEWLQEKSVLRLQCQRPQLNAAEKPAPTRLIGIMMLNVERPSSAQAQEGVARVILPKLLQKSWGCRLGKFLESLKNDVTKIVGQH
jgi:hypothetical protein